MSDIKKWISDIKKWIVDIINWIADLINWIADINKWIADITNSWYHQIGIYVKTVCHNILIVISTYRRCGMDVRHVPGPSRVTPHPIQNWIHPG